MKIKVRYHDPNMPLLRYNPEKGFWIDLSVIDVSIISLPESAVVRSSTVECLNDNFMLHGGGAYLLNLGVSIELPEGCEALLVPRSSTFKNYGIIQGNSVGIIDQSYCGDNDIWKMPVFATRDTLIPRYARIAQFRVFRPETEVVLIEDVEQLGNPDRGGFGSTGV